MTARAKKLSILLAALATSFAVVPFLNAQGITDADIQKTAEVMRAAGQTEAQIQRTIQSMKDAQKFTRDMGAIQASDMSEEEAARCAAGFSDSEVAQMEVLDQSLARQDAKISQMGLERDIAEFRAEHGDKPNATVSVEGEVLELKVVKCEREGELFSLYAEGEPVRNRRKGPTLNARRASAYGQGGYFESISFKTADFKSYGVNQRTGIFEGDTFSFEGMTDTSVVGEVSVPFSVTADCS